MPTPQCGGNRSAEGYRETTAPVTCKNCLKILAKEDATEQAPATTTEQAPETRTATVRTVGQTDITVSDPVGKVIRVKVPQGHHLQREDKVVIDARGFLVNEYGDDALEPMATALPEISQAALGYVKGALSQPYGMLPKHLPYSLRSKLLETGLIETMMVPKARWLGYGFQERDVLTRKAFAHFGVEMVQDTWRLSLMDALGHAEEMFGTRELDRLGIVWPADPYLENVKEPVYGSAAAVLGESLRITEECDRLSASPWLTITGPFGAEELARTRRETEERDAARIKEAEHPTAPVQQRTGLLSDDDLYVNREAWKATSAAMDSVGKALADQARARTAAVEAVMGLGSDALDALRYARETAARLRREAAERDIPNAWDRDTVYADNGEPMTFQNVRVPVDLVADYSGLQAITWRRGVNAAHRAAREEQGK